jgi:molybdate transport system substrate-binding protein
MSSTGDTRPRANWQPDWSLDLRLTLTRLGQRVLNQDQADVLAAIGRYNSISAAARGIGISYRHAWKLVQTANEAAGVPLIEAAPGGVRGGGARLTEHGRFALETYQQLRSELAATSGAVLQRIVRSTGDAGVNLHLAVAISLQETVGQLLAEYAQIRPLVHVRAVFGASNELADHLVAGAPCDLFVSADVVHLDQLQAAGIVQPGTSRKLATNGLAAIAVIGQQINVRKPRDLMSSAVAHVALAEPDCPLGKLSKHFLEAAGLYESLRPKVLHVDNSRGILAAIHSGVADVGLAFTSDAAKTAECQTLFQLRPVQASIDYAAAVPIRTANAEEANRLLDFFASPTGRRCFRRCGLRPI